MCHGTPIQSCDAGNLGGHTRRCPCRLQGCWQPLRILRGHIFLFDEQQPQRDRPICCVLQVDAALDLSHTQNIGRMIKAHFPQSQFIVVSLKEGMFNNANVLFRTKFVDGVSTVTRTATRRWAASGPTDRTL